MTRFCARQGRAVRLFAPLLVLVLPVILAGCRPHASAPGVASPPQPAPAPDSGARFTDRAQAAGIAYRWSTAGKRPLNILQSVGVGCGFLDYNNDGNLDILLVGPKLALYKGDGKGHFTDVTQAMGLDTLSGQFLGCAVGDYDNDGYDDVYLSGYRTGVLLHNVGGKRFTDVTRAAGLKPQPWGTSAAWLDPGDGRLALYVCNYVVFGPGTDPQLCNDNGHMTSCGPRYYQPEKGVLYQNIGGGKFRDVTSAWGAQTATGKGLGVAVADYDGSGSPSIAIADDEVSGDLLHRKNGKFKNIGALSGTAYDSEGNVHGGMGIDWGDYDNDGKLDLVVATFDHEAKDIYHNDGGSFFTDNSTSLGIDNSASPLVSFGVKWFDFNNDGWLDLIFASGHVQDNIAEIDKSQTCKQPLLLFRNDSGKAFRDVSAGAGAAFQTPIMGRGLAVGDYDNDGKLDVLIADGEGAPLLLHNETAPVGHWLSLTLRGTKSNQDGLGALVTVESGGLKQVRLCQTDGSYLSASDKRVSVGLGTAAQADSITVRWPSGHSDTYRNIVADRSVTLREGSSQAK